MAARSRRYRKNPLFMKVYTGAEPVLRKQCEPITEITTEIKNLVVRMITTMFENDIPGIGLAAPQVGISKQLIVLGIYESVADLPPNSLPGDIFLAQRMPLALINPKIISSSSETVMMEEGCLSVPNVHGNVVRPQTITIRATLINGEQVLLTCSNLTARCLQHEIDHLNGILFTDRVVEKSE